MSAIQKSAPDLIIVGSSVRGDELWIPRHMRYTRSGLYFYAPSIVEVLAGKV
jgi:UDP-N-acetyl-D-mannosaminuronic acid transferase (WecB/TagA/CpsF family)